MGRGEEGRELRAVKAGRRAQCVGEDGGKERANTTAMGRELRGMRGEGRKVRGERREAREENKRAELRERRR